MSNSYSETLNQKLNRRDLSPWAFAASVLLGASWILLSKLVQVEGLWVAAGTLVVMTAYVVAMMTVPALKLRRDQLGDNVYYLGFILTLVSLTVTLAQYAENSDEDYIISNFGVALAATVFGVFVRTMAAQMRRDVATVERDLQKALSEASASLKGEIGVSIEHFSVLNRRMEQVAVESVTAVAETNKQMALQLASAVDDSVQSLVASMESAVTQIESGIDDVVGGLKARVLVHEQVVEAINSYNEDLNNALGELSLDQKAVNKVAKVSEKLYGMAGDMEQAVAGMSSIIEQFNHSAGGLGQELSSLSSKATELSESAQATISGKIQLLEAQLDQTQTQATQIRVKLNNEVAPELDRATRTLTQATSALEAKTNSEADESTR